MKMKYVFGMALIFGTLSLSNTALAQQFGNGNELYEECKSQKASFNSGVCVGYISGVHDAHWDTVLRLMIAHPEQTNARFQLSYCLRDGVTLGQLRDVVVQYLERNPSERDKAAATLVINALAQAFPCAST